MVRVLTTTAALAVDSFADKTFTNTDLATGKLETPVHAAQLKLYDYMTGVGHFPLPDVSPAFLHARTFPLMYGTALYFV